MKTNMPFNTSHLPPLTLCCVLLLAGCINATTRIPYAGSVPPEKTCTLTISGTLTVRAFDGEAVNWKADSGDIRASVQIPEGSHSFILDYTRPVQGGVFSREGIAVSYDTFSAKHTYQMAAVEGTEAGGFTLLFTSTEGVIRDAVNKTLKIGIRESMNCNALSNAQVTDTFYNSSTSGIFERQPAPRSIGAQPVYVPRPWP